MVISFDIFDTCLIRRCGAPENVFWLLGRRLFGKDTTKAEMFLHWRKGAEDQAKQQLNKSCVTLSDIYRVAPNWLSQYKIKGEIEEYNLEAELLRAIPSTLSTLNKKRSEGCQIVFISDMYLSSRFLIQLMKNYGFYKDGDFVFVSCECGCTKSSGELYRYVEKKLGNKVNSHYGDNRWSDVLMAQKNKIKPVHIQSDYSKAEKYYLNRAKCNKYEFHLSCIIGIMRCARLTSSLSVKSGISADFVAPIWVAYTLDVLNKAKLDGLDRLYFLARDGYILKWTADKFKEYFPLLELRYLYVSRKSMFLPSISKWSRDSLEPYFGDNFKYVTRDMVYNYFRQIPGTAAEIIEKEAEKARYRINEYFIQEKIYDKESKYALVDVGWKGSGRVAFNNLQKLNCCHEREMWYWGTFENYRNKFEGLFYTYNNNLELPLYFITLVEDYFSTSPDLSTIDYQNECGKWIPVFDENSCIDNREILESNKYCISLYSEFIKEYSLMDSFLTDDISLYATEVLLFHPLKVDFEALSQINCFNENKGVRKGLVKKVSLPQLVNYFTKSYWEGIWCEGDLVYTYGKKGLYMKKLHDTLFSIVKKLK